MVMQIDIENIPIYVLTISLGKGLIFWYVILCKICKKKLPC